MRWKQSVIAAAAAFVMLYGCSLSPKAKEAKYLDKGKKALEEKNYGAAVLHFKTAMQAQPRDAEPYYELGMAYLGGKDYNSALSFFKKATELNPHHTEAQLKMAELLATSRDKENLSEAQKRTQDVLNLAPNNVDALDVLGITDLRLGKPESAEAHLEEALKVAPASLQSSIALAQARLARKDIAGAEEALKQAVAQAPNSAAPSVALGGFYLTTNKTAEAEQQFRHALQIEPKNGQALLALASMQVRAGQTDQAEQTYRQISALPDKQYKPVHALYLFETGKREQALAEFQKLAKDDPSDRALRTDLVRTYLSLNRVGDAENVLTAALKSNALDADALLQRARIYLNAGKLTEAQNDLNQVLHFRANSAEAHYLLAKVQQAHGDSSIQRQELGEALRLDPKYLYARVEQAQALLANNGAQSALELLDQTPNEQKGAVPIIVERNWALLALGQNAEARKGVDTVLKAARVPDALVQDGLLKLLQKDYAGTRASAEEELKLSPDDTRSLTLILQAYSLQKQAPAGLARIKEYAATRPSSAPVQQFLGQLLMTNGDRPGARKAFEAAKAANASFEGPQVALAQLDAMDGKRDDARKRVSALMAAHPKNLPGEMLWAELELADGKTDSAIDHYRKALAIDAKNTGALNSLAYLLAEHNHADEALRYAQEAKELAPDNPAVDDTLGWTYYQRGMYALAVTHLGSAVAKDGTAIRQYHLAMACLKAGDPKRGRQALESALKMDPNLPEAQKARQLFNGVAR
ncbi:MAG TPA: tetratricopeptide repeat protein [Bryobacteraceae bacterium]|nr:tetratricopeptide repeat protein [Bryobacteraceae bacterium]